MSKKHKLGNALALLLLSLAVMQAYAEEGSHRLKFRGKGPVCACSSGLGEAQIERAMKKLKLDQIQEPQANTRSTTAEDNVQNARRQTDDERK
jgi:hypothetical protein